MIYELLAEQTSEAILVVRIGPIVYKLLRPPEFFGTHPNWKLRMSRGEWLAEIRRRVDVSHRCPLLNPLLFCEECNVIVSRFVDGRRPTADELQEIHPVTDSWRIGDATESNVIISATGPILVDFVTRYR